MRVLQVLPGLKTDGIAVVVTNYYRFIDKTQVQFDFAVENQKPNKYDDFIEESGGKIFRLPDHSSKLLNPLRYIKALKRLVKEGDYKVVHIHGNSAILLFLAALAVKLSGNHAKVIFSSHSRSCEQMLLHKLFRPFACAMADHRFACSKPAGVHMYKKKRFQILSNAIDFGKYAYNEEKRAEVREQRILSDRFILGFSGRVSPPKNPLFLVDVFKEVQKKVPTAKLMVCGDGLMMKALYEKVKGENVKGVICTGSIQSTEDYLSAMDVMLLPSLYEGLPMALLEAQANGLPSICSENIPEEAIFSDSVQVIPLAEIDRWVEKIVSISQQRERSSFAGDPALTGYDIKAESEKLAKFYLSLI